LKKTETFPARTGLWKGPVIIYKPGSDAGPAEIGFYQEAWSPLLFDLRLMITNGTTNNARVNNPMRRVVKSMFFSIEMNK